MKSTITNYTFSASAKTVTFNGLSSFNINQLLAIINQTAGVVIYSQGIPNKGYASITSNSVVLQFDTTAMADTDELTILYQAAANADGLPMFAGYDDIYDKLMVGNARSKFRDDFSSPVQPSPDRWDITPGSHTASGAGDAAGAGYVKISLNPWAQDDEFTMISKASFKQPFRLGWGLSMSQRFQGQEVLVAMVACDSNGNVLHIADRPPLAITGTTISITSNVATVTLNNHGLKGNDRIVIAGCPEKRLNVGPVIVTVVDKNNFTVPCTLANGSYNCVGGSVYWADPLDMAYNGCGLLCENATTTNATFTTRRNGGSPRQLNSTIASTTATQSNTSPYSDAFNSANANELMICLDEAAYRSWSADSTSSMSGHGKWTQATPDEDYQYKILIRAKNLKNLSVPVAKITAVSKSGSTLATVTTDRPHGLATNDWVHIFGVRDQTNFPNISSQTQITVTDATHFTFNWSASATASSAGGTVFLCNGSVTAPGIITQIVQSVTRTNGVLILVGNATWSGILPGETYDVSGMDGAAAAYDGTYKVLRVNGTSLELDATGQPDFGTINCGGTLIRRTDVRLHYFKVMDYTRHAVEVVGGRGSTSDTNNSVPVSVASGNVTASQGGGSNTYVWNAAGWGGFLVADIASAAITANTTTSAITPGYTANIGTFAHQFACIVTAVSGTTPTYDLSVEESMDNGTNWIRVYDFPRITANGAYFSPIIRATAGTRYRYVQTLGGTTPSFTRAVNRIQWAHPGVNLNQFVDRSVNWNTLNSTTPVYFIDGADTFQVTINSGAITTTAPQFQLEGSEDNLNWYSIGSPITAVASSTVNSYTPNVCIPKFIRLRVSTAGVGATAGYVSIKAIGR